MINITDTMRSFLERLENEEELQKKLQDCKSPEEAFAVAKDAVSELDKNEFFETMKKINDSVAKNESGELSDSDLEQVAGGLNQGDRDTLIFIAAVPAAAAAI